MYDILSGMLVTPPEQDENSGMLNEHIFITGMPRSGTTLLDKVLSYHTEVTVHSQPLPLLFSEVKSLFLESIGNAGVYPLSDMVHKNYYKPEQWFTFLHDFSVDADLYKRLSHSMSSFSGQYTRLDHPLAYLKEFKAASVSEFVKSYLSELGNTSKMVGLKETWSEEYLPYFLANGFKCILIIRDPRDVICSLNFGQGREYGGRVKPLLYNIRSWRKSVAFALAMSEESQIQIIRYEDLVSKPEEIIPQLFNFLAVESCDVEGLVSNVVDQSGKKWRSNSSHSQVNGISNSSIGRYKEYLTDEVIEFVEACCFHEMKYFSYDVEVGPDRISQVIEEYNSEEQIEREELVSYRWSASRRDEELKRIELIENVNFNAQYFIFKAAFDRLATAFN